MQQLGRKRSQTWQSRQARRLVVSTNRNRNPPIQTPVQRSRRACPRRPAPTGNRHVRGRTLSYIEAPLQPSSECNSVTPLAHKVPIALAPVIPVFRMTPTEETAMCPISSADGMALALRAKGRPCNGAVEKETANEFFRRLFGFGVSSEPKKPATPTSDTDASKADLGSPYLRCLQRGVVALSVDVLTCLFWTRADAGSAEAN
jgi:hypothetical protein